MAGPDLRSPNIASSHSHVRHGRQWRGFTLVELVVVIAIIGILAAMGAERYFDRRGFDRNAFAEQARAMLRFSQKLAIGQNRAVFAQLNGSTIALCFSGTAPCPAASRVPSLGSNGGAAACAPASWYCEAPAGTIAYAVTPTSASTICFNALGQPGVLSGSLCSPSGYTGATINITGDGSTTAVSVASETGYVF